jgi:hypothetical protein
LQEKYWSDSLTHPELDPNLWLEVGSSGRLDRNQVYGIFNTMDEDMWMTHSVSTIGSSQSGLSQ